MLKQITQLVKRSLRRHIDESREESALAISKIDGELTDNMRALRLIATIAEQLQSRGMAASDVVHISLRVATTYCSRKVHIDVSNTILTLSQDRGIDREPLTLIRAVPHRSSDYRLIQLLEELVRDIRAGWVTLDDAEKRLDTIIALPRAYPRWVTHASSGGLSAGVVLLYSSNPLVWLIAFVMGFIVSALLYKLAKVGLPNFFSQALAGVVVTVIAAFAALVATVGVVPILRDIDPTLIIVAGIVLLTAGMAVVSAFRDAIDEYYITASARLLRVAMLTGGIVLGATIGLYIASQLGVQLAATPDRLTLGSISYQYLGAAIMSAAFALGNRARLAGVLSAGVVGLLSLFIVISFTDLGFGVIPATGIAAACVGLAATIVLRLFGTPTLATINAGIIPLVPGMTLYSGMTHIAQTQPNTAEFDLGIGLLLRALLIAVTIAVGATFGNMIGRSARRRMIHRQNRLPAHKLSVHKTSDDKAIAAQ